MLLRCMWIIQLFAEEVPFNPQIPIKQPLSSHRLFTQQIKIMSSHPLFHVYKYFPDIMPDIKVALHCVGQG